MLAALPPVKLMEAGNMPGGRSVSKKCNRGGTGDSKSPERSAPFHNMEMRPGTRVFVYGGLLPASLILSEVQACND